jgi:hypothetical protein
MRNLIQMLPLLACVWPAMLQAAPGAAPPATVEQHGAAYPHTPALATAPRIIRPKPVIRHALPARLTTGAIGGPAVAHRHDHSARPVGISGTPGHTSATTAAISGSDIGHGH